MRTTPKKKNAVRKSSVPRKTTAQRTLDAAENIAAALDRQNSLLSRIVEAQELHLSLVKGEIAHRLGPDGHARAALNIPSDHDLKDLTTDEVLALRDKANDLAGLEVDPTRRRFLKKRVFELFSRHVSPRDNFGWALKRHGKAMDGGRAVVRISDETTCALQSSVPASDYPTVEALEDHILASLKPGVRYDCKLIVGGIILAGVVLPSISRVSCADGAPASPPS